MKRHIKLFEDFSDEGFVQDPPCCNPLSLLNLFEKIGGDMLHYAALKVKDLGFEVAEATAEGAEEAMAVRALRSCSSSAGVDAIKMIDLLEDMRHDLSHVRAMLNALEEKGRSAVLRIPGGREFLRRITKISC